MQFLTSMTYQKSFDTIIIYNKIITIDYFA